MPRDTVPKNTVPATMRAVWLEAHGGVEVLHVIERPTPAPAPHEVLIAVHAASINPRDWMIRAGTYLVPPLRPKPPLILGSDVAGTVVAVGAEVDAGRFPIGRRVFAMRPSRDGFGAYAEFAAVRASSVVPIPARVGFVDAAAAPLAAMTALQALRDEAGLARRDAGSRSVAIIGASGGVGTYAVQIARALGAARVAGVASGRNEELVRGLGATDFVDYRSQDVVEALRAAGRLDVVFDAVGRHDLAWSRPMLRPGGVYVTTVPTFGALWDDLRTRVARSLPGGRSRPSARLVAVRSRGDDLRQIADWMAAGSVRSVIDRRAPLDEVRSLHEHSRTFRSRGKNVLIVRDGS